MANYEQFTRVNYAMLTRGNSAIPTRAEAPICPESLKIGTIRRKPLKPRLLCRNCEAACKQSRNGV